MKLEELLGTDYKEGMTAEEIWEKANAQINAGGFTPRELIERSNVEFIGTTDDPADYLEYHKEIAKDKNLEELSLELAPEIKAKLLQEIIRLGDKKKNVSASDLPFLIANALKTPLESRIKVIDYHIISNAQSMPIATVKIDCDGTTVDHCSEGDGGYDAFVKALRRCLKELNLDMPKLLDYEVRIPPGGKTDALVETTITWDYPLANGISNLTTTGVDSDQMVAAIIATEKMLNLVMQKNEKKS